MGYSYGTRWTDEKIKDAILEVMKKADIQTMPTHSQIMEVTQNNSLCCAISKHGGTVYWAEKLGLEIKKSESKYGYKYEQHCKEILISKGFECEKMQERYPYDLTANRNIKIDVKAGNLYSCKHGCFYTFNLEKRNPTCDIFVCFCIDGEEIVKTYVIPSCVLQGIKQLTVGQKNSKYDKYKDNWSVLERYDEFYKQIGE